jgi:hypothetical protein
MKSPFVAQVTAFEWTPFDRPVMASFEIVERYRAVSSARQRLARMATNEAGPTSYEDRCHCSLTPNVEYVMNPDVDGKRFLNWLEA